MTSLNPVFTVERQAGEVLRRHLGLSKADARKRVVELLDIVGIHTRCPLEEQSRPQSEQETPGLIDVGDGHMVACHLAGPGREVPRVA